MTPSFLYWGNWKGWCNLPSKQTPVQSYVLLFKHIKFMIHRRHPPGEVQEAAGPGTQEREKSFICIYKGNRSS